MVVKATEAKTLKDLSDKEPVDPGHDKAETPEMPEIDSGPVEYRLRRRFFDGLRLHDVGTVLSFPEGGAPSSAVRVK